MTENGLTSQQLTAITSANPEQLWKMLEAIHKRIPVARDTMLQRKLDSRTRTLRSKEELVRALTVRKGEMIDGVENEVDIICIGVIQDPFIKAHLQFEELYEILRDKGRNESGITYIFEFKVEDSIVNFKIESFYRLGLEYEEEDMRTSVSIVKPNKTSCVEFKGYWFWAAPQDTIFDRRYLFYRNEPISSRFFEEYRMAIRACERLLIWKQQELGLKLC